MYIENCIGIHIYAILADSPDSGHHSQSLPSDDRELECSACSILGDEATTESPDTEDLQDDNGQDPSLVVDALTNQQPGTIADAKGKS